MLPDELRVRGAERVRVLPDELRVRGAERVRVLPDELRVRGAERVRVLPDELRVRGAERVRVLPDELRVRGAERVAVDDPWPAGTLRVTPLRVRVSTVFFSPKELRTLLSVATIPPRVLLLDSSLVRLP